MRWISTFEQEANIKLFGHGSQGRLLTQMNAETLLRGNSSVQQEFISAMIDRGSRVGSECFAPTDLFERFPKHIATQ